MNRFIARGMVAVAGAMCLSASALAVTVAYDVSGGYWDKLGWDGSQSGVFDELWLGNNSPWGNSLSSSWSGLSSTPSVVALEYWRFDAGLNSNSNHTDPVSFTQTLTVNGNTQSFTQSGTIDINNSDTLTVGSSSTLWFNLGSGQYLQFKALGFTAGPNGGGSMTGQVNALVSVGAVPEPFTMGLGLAAAGVFVRRRMKKA